MNRTFLGILFATGLTGFALGYAKFFWLECLFRDVFDSQLSSKPMLIQVVSAFITLGPVLVYIISGPIAASTRKWKVMAVTSAICALMYLLALVSGAGQFSWFYLFFTGLIMGIFSAGKMSCVVLEYRNSGRSPYAVNGGMSIVFLLGMMTGTPSGAYLGKHMPQNGMLLTVVIFTLAALSSTLVRFKTEPLQKFKTTFEELGRDTWRLMTRYLDYLIASPMIWGMAATLSLAVTAYLENRYIASNTQASLVSLYSTIGIILGNAWAPRLQAIRHEASVRWFLILMISIAAFPLIFKTLPLAIPENPDLQASIDAAINLNYWPWYPLAVAMMLLIGFAFGVVTNIVDADFLRLASDMGLEGTGAALQSAFVAFFSFLIGASAGIAFIKDWVNADTQFLFIIGICFLILSSLMAILIKYGDPRAFARKVIRPVLLFAARLRYKIDVQGLKELPKDKGFVFLPNHPAEVDPLLVTLVSYRKFRPRPFVTEKFVEMGGLKPFMKLIRAVAVPDTDDGAGTFKLKRIQQCLDQCIEDVKNQDSFLFYPAGRLQRSGLEDLRGASGLFELLQKDPDLAVVLVRTRGLWGSRFSTALTHGITPDLGLVLKECVLDLIKNLIFFAPRRHVTMEFVQADPARLQSFADKLSLNQYLNEFYNAHGEEELKLTPRYFFSSATAEIQAVEAQEESYTEVSKEIEEAVICEIASRTGLNVQEIEPRQSLSDDLGMDSLDRAELLPWLDETFHQTDVEVTELTTVGSVMKAAAAKQAPDAETGTHAPMGWTTEDHPPVASISSPTLVDAVLQRIAENPKAIACGDEVTGVLTRSRFLIGALALADTLRELPGQRLGILMPASNGASVMTFAALLAGKTPVMLNWTVGARNMKHVRDICNLQNVLTSRRFLDRAGDIDLGVVEDLLLFVEDLREEAITLPVKLKAWLDSKKSPAKLKKQLKLQSMQSDDTAVILFTSGSESAPKGVPLTHTNLLNNIREALKAVKLNSNDILYGFLPPFHSFGFTITTMLPLVAGLRVAFYPNPTDARRLARGMGMWGVTLACGTPSFLRRILAQASEAQTSSLRFLLTGAEKADEELFSMVSKTPASLLEGYGITECSPVISLNREHEPRTGVGKPIDGTRIKIVDPQTMESRCTGEQGLILVQGDSVFAGYLGEAKDPFFTDEQGCWYQTGDLGYLNQSGALTLSGRMKRFVKIAGEMISLPAMESILSGVWPGTEEGPALAVEALEIDGQRPRICLFTTKEGLTVEEANKTLREAGFATVGRLSEVQTLPAIPLLGTGKTDYVTLKSRLQAD